MPCSPGFLQCRATNSVFRVIVSKSSLKFCKLWYGSLVAEINTVLIWFQNGAQHQTCIYRSIASLTKMSYSDPMVISGKPWETVGFQCFFSPPPGVIIPMHLWTPWDSYGNLTGSYGIPMGINSPRGWEKRENPMVNFCKRPWQKLSISHFIVCFQH